MVGRQFERMVGLVKHYMYKETGKVNVIQKDLKQIISDTEIILSNRPMIYVDDDIHSILSVNIKYTPTWTTYSSPKKKNSRTMVN